MANTNWPLYYGPVSYVPDYDTYNASLPGQWGAIPGKPSRHKLGPCQSVNFNVLKPPGSPCKMWAKYRLLGVHLCLLHYRIWRAHLPAGLKIRIHPLRALSGGPNLPCEHSKTFYVGDGFLTSQTICKNGDIVVRCITCGAMI